MRLSNVISRRGIQVSDDIHERLLRRLLRQFPFRLDLTRTLVGLICKSGRAPLPDSAETLESGPDDCSDLIGAGRAEAEAGDTIGLYANLWQAIVQHPAQRRGWSELALAFAERRMWSGAREASAKALVHPGAIEQAAATSLTKALNRLAENRELGNLPWRDWVEALPNGWQDWPDAVSLRLLAGDATLGPRVERMVSAFGSDVSTYFVAALQAYKKSDFEKHNGLLQRAFEIDADDALWQTVTKYGAQVAWTLQRTGAADDFAAWLSQRSVNTLIPSDPSPESVQQATLLREQALERGLPSPIFIPQAKSGSASVANIFNSGFRLPTAVFSLLNQRVIEPWLQDYMRGGACYATHLLPSPTNVALLAKGGVHQVIVHVRDPRQILISELEHFKRYSNQATISTLDGYKGGEEGLIDAAIDRALPEIIQWTSGWVAARDKLNVAFTTFEDFVTDRGSFTDRVVGLYGGDTRHFHRAHAITEHAGLDYHRRLGSIDEWRKRLSPPQIDRVNRIMPAAFWGLFGWEP